MVTDSFRWLRREPDLCFIDRLQGTSKQLGSRRVAHALLGLGNLARAKPCLVEILCCHGAEEPGQRFD